MKLICINDCYGGFGLSDVAMELYLTKAGKVPFYSHKYRGCTSYATTPFTDGKAENGTYFHDSDIDRDDPILIEVVQQLGKKANGDFADLKIVKIPDDVNWEIDEYDGNESVREQSRSWY